MNSGDLGTPELLARGRSVSDGIGGLAIFTAAAPVVHVEDFLSLATELGERERVLWDDARDDWAVAGLGSLARLEAWGEGARLEILSSAEKLFRSMAPVGLPPHGAPPPRLLGGFAFAPGLKVDPLWKGFADASFVLPRWTYARAGNEAFLQLAVLGQERADARERAMHVVRRLQLVRNESDLEDRARSFSAASRAHVERMPPADWAELVDSALSVVQRGDLEKVVVARKTTVTLPEMLDVASLARRMTARDPSCTRFVVERGASRFIGATPERLIRLRGSEVETEALAGSIPRTGRNDDGERAALLRSEKDLREHAIVRAMLCAALEPLASSLRAPAEPVVRSLGSVHHLATPIEAVLARPAHVLELAHQLHPTPAVCGRPSGKARAWIRENEAFARGWYGAPVGWFDAQGDGAFAVGIRSAVLQGGNAHVFAGAGIVRGSRPETEYAETIAKEATMLYVLGVSA